MNIFKLIAKLFGGTSKKKTPVTTKPIQEKSNTLHTSNSTRTNLNYSNTFNPIKIIDNDNTLTSIVPDYEIRKQKAIKTLEANLGKALPNDVIWSILQDLYIENILKDHKVFLNAVYQQGLITQKEKKYQQAITHYCYGLYYLMNFYKSKFNPTAHIIDFINCDTQLIELAQYKFINKIQRCMKYENIDFLQVGKFAYELISRTPLPYIKYEDFLIEIKPHLEKTNKNTYASGTIGSMQNKELAEWEEEIYMESDIIDGLIFEATLQLRIPIKVLKHHGEIFKENNKRPPTYAKEEWQGIWLPRTKSWSDLGFDDEKEESTSSSEIGYVLASEYLPFLIKFRTIIENDLSIEDKVLALKTLKKEDKDFNKFWKKHNLNSRGVLEKFLFEEFEYKRPIDKNSYLDEIDGINSKVYNLLSEAGYKKVKDLKKTTSKELLALKGIGKVTVNKLEKYAIFK